MPITCSSEDSRPKAQIKVIQLYLKKKKAYGVKAELAMVDNDLHFERSISSLCKVGHPFIFYVATGDFTCQ